MKTAFSYIRFSSKPQERGDSLRRQVRLARDYATKHDLILDERSYQDLGISAFKGISEARSTASRCRRGGSNGPTVATKFG